MKHPAISSAIAAISLCLTSCGEPSSSTPVSHERTECSVELIVLGAGQDAGAPQIGNADDPAWRERSEQLTATSLAIVDYDAGARYLFEATPHITEQLHLLDRAAPMTTEKKPDQKAADKNLGLNAIFLTHAHIGHYAGLIFLGKEAASTSLVPVYAMERMGNFLRTNGPWEQLVSAGNIEIVPLINRQVKEISPTLSVTPLRVPHRDEYSETVGFIIQAGDKSVLFIPDIDSWQEWDEDFDTRLEDMVTRVDLSFIDASFFDDNELPGRDMSAIPHPRVRESMALLQSLPPVIRATVHFIHYNHTNPIRFAQSAQSAMVYERGFNIARAGNRHCLSDG